MNPIVNLDELTLDHYAHGDKFEVRDGAIGSKVGAKLLGYSLAVVPPGKRAYPFHCHHVNEEMFFVVEGQGVVRVGDREYPIRKGDVIAAPPGGRETAHQIINTSNEELRYLMVSTMFPTDVVEYPDSNKVAVYVGSAPGGDPSVRTFNHRGRLARIIHERSESRSRPTRILRQIVAQRAQHDLPSCEHDAPRDDVKAARDRPVRTSS